MMEIYRYATNEETGKAAAADGAERIRKVLKTGSRARIIVATGASQFEMLAGLVAEPGIDWACVEVYHLDEYIGLPATHPASFRKYLRERFEQRLPGPVAAFHYIHADMDPERECARVGALIGAVDIDVAFVGIGENGHLAFNDPPADFETDAPYLVVDLDEACRRQQFGEGWFERLEDVPTRAVSMSVRQILKSKHIVCTVPDRRKAEAVRNAVEGPVTPDVPASILQEHPSCGLFLDVQAAELLSD